MIVDDTECVVLTYDELQWLRQSRPHPLQHQRSLPQYLASLLAIAEHKPLDAHCMHDVPPASDVARIGLCRVELAQHLHLRRGERLRFMMIFSSFLRERRLDREIR